MRIFILFFMLLAGCGETLTKTGDATHFFVIGKLTGVSYTYEQSKITDQYGDKVIACGSSIATYEVFSAQSTSVLKLKQSLDEECDNSFYDLISESHYQLIFLPNLQAKNGIIEISNSYNDDEFPFYMFNVFSTDGTVYADISDNNFYDHLEGADTDTLVDGIYVEDIVVVDDGGSSGMFSLMRLLQHYGLEDHVKNFETPPAISTWNQGIWTRIDPTRTFANVHDTRFRSIDDDNNIIYLNRALMLGDAFPEITKHMLETQTIGAQQ